MRKRALILLLTLLSGSHGFAQSKAYLDKINEILNTFSGDTALSHASWGFCLIHDKTGQRVAEKDGQRSLQPASTTKVLTTGAALSILGGDYSFTTRLYYTGYIDKKGLLKGDIYIKGSGDPTLGFARMQGVQDEKALIETWASRIHAAGIKNIEGRVIADASWYDKAMQPDAWAWDDIANYYGAGPCGLTFHENQYNLYLRQGKKPGEPTSFVNTYPAVKGLTVYNDITAGPAGSGDNGYIYGAPYTYLRYLRGTVPSGDSLFCIKGSFPDPALQCAQALAEKLRTGKEMLSATTYYLLQEQGRQYDTTGLKLIYSLRSPVLRDIVKYTNEFSINLYAETLLKETGRKARGTGSTDEGLRAMKSFWQSKGLDLDGLFLRDGSGLSRYDAVTPGQFAHAMHIMRSDAAFKDFYASLPVAGRSGSLYGIGKGTAAEGNMHAKSGYMTRVRSYAGYVKNKDGEDFSFAFIINNYSESAWSVKVKIEKLLVALAE